MCIRDRPYSHGLSSLANEDCFKEEVMRQSAKMKQMFGKAPKAVSYTHLGTQQFQASVRQYDSTLFPDVVSVLFLPAYSPLHLLRCV